MKKLIAPITVVILAGMLFSSCGNMSKISITKRHYRGGYFVDFGGGRTIAPTPSVKRILNRTTPQNTSVVIAKPELPVDVNAPTDVSQKTDIAQNFVASKKIKISGQKLMPARLSHSDQFNSYQLLTMSNTPEQNTSPSEEQVCKINVGIYNDAPGVAGDGNRSRENNNIAFIVIVLCAIFIPPLGVGLMYGLNSYFWIDLILTLLFFFPGMIFALIVILM